MLVLTVGDTYCIINNGNNICGCEIDGRENEDCCGGPNANNAVIIEDVLTHLELVMSWAKCKWTIHILINPQRFQRFARFAINLQNQWNHSGHHNRTFVNIGTLWNIQFPSSFVQVRISICEWLIIFGISSTPEIKH